MPGPDLKTVGTVPLHTGQAPSHVPVPAPAHGPKKHLVQDASDTRPNASAHPRPGDAAPAKLHLATPAGQSHKETVGATHSVVASAQAGTTPGYPGWDEKVAKTRLTALLSAQSAQGQEIGAASDAVRETALALANQCGAGKSDQDAKIAKKNISKLMVLSTETSAQSAGPDITALACHLFPEHRAALNAKYIKRASALTAADTLQQCYVRLCEADPSDASAATFASMGKLVKNFYTYALKDLEEINHASTIKLDAYVQKLQLSGHQFAALCDAIEQVRKNPGPLHSSAGTSVARTLGQMLLHRPDIAKNAEARARIKAFWPEAPIDLEAAAAPAQQEPMAVDFREIDPNAAVIGKVNFDRLLEFCKREFGEQRHNGTSHIKFTTEWGLVNLQRKGPNAKDYQVRQVLKVLQTKRASAAGGAD